MTARLTRGEALTLTIALAALVALLVLYATPCRPAMKAQSHEPVRFVFTSPEG